MKQRVIGLSGHIDHGKTALVNALTGTNTDSLSEEQKRGMTIDLGFAFLNDSITMIDVPGHEKFVKNMMAGVSTIDLALLVIAADDGVMPQTREHFEILNLLNIQTGIIALNKVDLSDDEWLELVELDINELVEGSFLEDAPIVRVSATKNIGIDELKQILLSKCEQTPEKNDRGIFRMHIDRAFNKRGFGTVVTGTVNSGSIKLGDNVEIFPKNQISRVRGLQSHGSEVSEICIGDRAAINLHGIDKNIIKRGSQIAEPGYIREVHKLGVSINLLSSSKKTLSQNQRVRVHLGTQEVMSRIAFTNIKSLNQGESASAMLRLESSLVAARGDRFIIRTYSPIVTIGGGEVLDVSVDLQWKLVKGKLNELFDQSSDKQIVKLIEQEGVNPLTCDQLKYRLGISNEKILNLVKSNDDLFWKKYKQSKWIVTSSQWKKIKIMIISYLENFHEKSPMKGGVLKEPIRQYLQTNELVIDLLLQELELEKKILQKDEIWSLATFKLELNSTDDLLQTKILSILDTEGFSSSNIIELSKLLKQDQERLLQIIKVAEKQGKIIRIVGNLIFTKNNFKKLEDKVYQYFLSNNSMSVSEFKELAQTSRKYAVPLLEYLDKLKITYREGNIRKLIK